MSIKAATAGESRPISPGHKRTKLAEAEHSDPKQTTPSKVVHISKKYDVADVVPSKRQYITCSKVIATTSRSQ
jgi:hypothetical protein